MGEVKLISARVHRLAKTESKIILYLAFFV